MMGRTRCRSCGSAPWANTAVLYMAHAGTHCFFRWSIAPSKAPKYQHNRDKNNHTNKNKNTP
jgi:hypothetical protein